jgi:hypothetical protein
MGVNLRVGDSVQTLNLTLDGYTMVTILDETATKIAEFVVVPDLENAAEGSTSRLMPRVIWRYT